MSSLKYCKTGYKYCELGNAGFSLIEIMVGMVMGLISMVIVMQVFATFEGQKRTTTSGSDAQTNGGVGLYTIERDLRMAGYGFADALGCTVNTTQNTTINQTPPGSLSFVLAPVTITQGLGGLPDTISVMASNKQNWSVPVRIVNAHAQTDTFFIVSSTIGIGQTNTISGIAQNDLLIDYETNAPDALINPGALNKPCTLVQMSNVDPVLKHVTHTGGSWNGNSATAYTDNAMLINVGSLMVHYYSLDANSNLITQEYDSANPAQALSSIPAQTLSSDVVNLQAQYGFDTRSDAAIHDPATGACPLNTGSGQCSIVDTWSDTPPVDLSRIYAIRFAVVARSGLKEKPDAATGMCNTTTASPTWAGGTILLTANADWKCYRYKTFETIVPLRNPIWKQR